MKTGLLFRQIIFAVPIYKYDSQLSCLVSIPMPLNVINVFLIPIFLIVKNPKKRKSINRAILMITYLPFGLFSTIVFAALNLCLLPFAFVKSLLHKILIVFRVQKPQCLVELIQFTFFGLPMMTCGQIVEIKQFVVHLLNWEQKQRSVSSTIHIITAPVFSDFITFLRQQSLTLETINAGLLVKQV